MEKIKEISDTFKVQDERYKKRVQEYIDNYGLSIREWVMIANGYATFEELKKEHLHPQK